MGKKYKLGLVLSGGGARGMAHMGALKALQEEGIEPDIVAGTSAGSIVGAMWAAGIAPEEMLNIARKANLFKMLMPAFSRNGLVRLTHLREMLMKHIPYVQIEDLPRPFVATAVELLSGKVEYFRSGSLADAVVASCSVPLVVKPLELEGKFYVDGGLMKNLPVSAIREECELIMAFDVLPSGRATPKGICTTSGLLMRVVQLGISCNTRDDLAQTDFYLPFSGLKATAFDFFRREKIFEQGYKQAQKKLRAFKQAVSEL